MKIQWPLIFKGKAKGEEALESGAGHFMFGMLIKLPTRLRLGRDLLECTVNTVTTVCTIWQVVRFMSVLFHALPWKQTPEIKMK